ncbi:MAG: PIN domain-containing protein [Spirochaetales bacterium]|jgi:predicted nucleic acid-binding protein|nr:PIN domain-containing protein [Spirochaetales bacterium]
MNGTKIVFDICAGIKLLDGKYNLASLGDDIDHAQQFTSVIVAPLDNSVEKIAVEIRRTTTIKLPDCIVAATAIALGAILLTDDQGLKKLVWPGLKTLAL